MSTAGDIFAACTTATVAKLAQAAGGELWFGRVAVEWHFPDGSHLTVAHGVVGYGMKTEKVDA